MNRDEIKTGFSLAAKTARTVKNVAQIASCFFATAGIYSLLTEESYNAYLLGVALLLAFFIERLTHLHGLTHFYNVQKFGFRRNIRSLSAVSWLIFLVIFAANPATSYVGSDKVKLHLAPAVEKTNYAALDSVRASLLRSAGTSYARDSSSLAQRAAAQKRAVWSKYAASIAQQVQLRAKHKANHERGHIWALSHVRKTDEKIADLKTQRAAELARVETEYTDKLAERLASKDSSAISSQAYLAARLQEEQSYAELLNAQTFSVWLSSSALLIFLALGSSFITFFCLIFITRYMVKAGIDLEPVEFQIKKSFAARLLSALNTRVDKIGQNIIDKIELKETEIETPSGAESPPPPEGDKKTEEDKIKHKRQTKRQKTRTRKRGRKSSIVPLKEAYERLKKTGQKINHKDLAREAGVSTKTVQRHIDKIRTTG